ncbi:uncharacterized protein JN550_006549 [Neoarthrinium moseri]|uniref:uncharacterized protein n=1 Tax=Neoarthrinium moseri TaxID=1658444 RepID=UPI001FDAD737|nr:uncharacterized protein JN550_006549 [Neoarthrinium moseri]KAI1868061.1 hypothetical protein JN550_006549 [Neoarthrinium moseri]
MINLSLLILSLLIEPLTGLSLGAYGPDYAPPQPGKHRGNKLTEEMQWEGYFLTQCTDSTNPRLQFSEVAWYRNASLSCPENGNKYKPRCHPPHDWGWIGNQAPIDWAAQPGEWVKYSSPCCKAIRRYTFIYMNQRLTTLCYKPAGKFAGEAVGSATCWAEYFCQYKPPKPAPKRVTGKHQSPMREPGAKSILVEPSEL